MFWKTEALLNFFHAETDPSTSSDQVKSVKTKSIVTR